MAPLQGKSFVLALQVDSRQRPQLPDASIFDFIVYRSRDILREIF